MFIFAIALIIYSYSLFFLGLLHLLYAPIIFIWTAVFCISCFFVVRFEKKKGLLLVQKKAIADSVTHKKSYSFYFILGLIILQCFVNVLAVFMRETGFDALWYHLTIPKLYLLHHAVFHIPGGILYYTDMPKLIDMLYVLGLSFGTAFVPKLIHFFFGVLILILTYKIGRKFFSPLLSLLAVLLFSTNLVWSWEMGSAYIDLGRTFFELMAFWTFLIWTEKRKNIYFLFIGIFLGAAIASKLIAIGSFFIFFTLLFFVHQSEKKKIFFQQCFTLFFISALIPLPWLVFSLIQTGNPFYPLFSSAYPVHNYFEILNPFFFIQSMWHLFIASPDPLSPIYIIVLPLICFYWKKLYQKFPYLLLYVCCSFFIWYITPQSGGGRFILPYLPVFSLLVVALFTFSLKKQWKIVFFAAIIGSSLISIGYRAAIAKKYVPFFLKKENSQQYLVKNLAFSLGDFADTDSYFATHIKPTDTVLLYGFHNLYYIDFPFIDSSWVRSGDMFNYIAVQNGNLPKRFSSWQRIYFNPVTHVQLFKAGGLLWTY